MALRSDELLWAKCFHPSGKFIEFAKEEVESSVPKRFEKIVRMYPDHLAIKTPAGALTYDEVNCAANRVAHMLLAQERRDPEPVALLLAKRMPMIVAMLGVLKAGRCFVLLDSSLPKEKITTLLRKSQAKLVLTDAGNLQVVREAAGNGFNIIDYESVLRRKLSTNNPELSLSPGMVACVVYTSGSTGEQKGVVWSHRFFLHHVMLVTNKFHLCEEDKISLLASISGSALANIGHALLNGATLYAYDILRSGVRKLANWLIREEISVWFMPSPLFRNLAASVKGHNQFSNVRLIRLGSDKVYRSDIELCKKILPPNCIIANMLSTTETGVIRMNLMDQRTTVHGNEVPVGFPVEDKELSIIDDAGKEVGFNEVGEIVVRSRYLSPGYWNSPQLTKAKFRRVPQDSDMCVYYTGDLGLMLPDGCLVHKGRKDFRIKVRGYGVDLIEVEKALLSHSGIWEAVAAPQKMQSGEARLCAYFTAASEQTSTVSELRAYLQNKLAGYEIPSVFVRLDRMPLDSSGKIDRNALPTPDHSRPNLDTAYVAARTSVEHELAGIWADVLAIDEVGVHDNFFELGGDSLAATRVISQVVKQFKLEVPLQSLFQAPTVAEMANVITGHRGKMLGEKEMANILTELEALSDAEAHKRLSESSSPVVKNK